jgi:hypothetical protein
LASAKVTEMDDKAKTEDIQDNTRWCWFYDRNTGLDFLERSVKEKLGTANTLFLPWMSIELHLKMHGTVSTCTRMHLQKKWKK